MEIEKIHELADKASDARMRESILQAESVISETFRQVLNNARTYVVNGSVACQVFTEAKEAMRLLNEYGTAHGVDFPYPENDDAVKDYVMQYGREIIWHKK